MFEAGSKIVKALNITGPFNAQFIVSTKDDSVKVIGAPQFLTFPVVPLSYALECIPTVIKRHLETIV